MLKAKEYYNRGNFKRALQLYQNALRKDPTNRNLLLDAGASCYGLGKPELAYDYTKRCYAQDNSFGMAANNIALYHQMVGEAELAIKWYDRAVQLGYDEAKFNRSLQLLKLASIDGKGWEYAFNEYEYRFKKLAPVKLPNVEGRKRWDGGAVKVLVIAEQGIGDCFMFARYLDKLADYDFCVAKELMPFFDKAVEHTYESTAEYYVPMGSLPKYFGPVKCPVQNILKGSEIGVCWKGNSSHKNDVNRSYPELKKEFLKLGTVNLQFGVNKDIKSWQDTIDLIDRCHTIITVDTSIAHIAALRGRRVMVLQPKYDWDWRWGIDGKSVWYDNVESYKTFEELCSHI